MEFDLGAVALVAVLASLGAFSGALRQLVRLAAFAIALLGAAPLGSWLAATVAGSGDPSAGAAFVGTGATFLVTYLLVAVVGGFVARRLTEGDEARAVDRGTGAILGALKGLIAAWAIAAAALRLHELGLVGWTGESSVVAALARALPLF
ncbi:CvpA family protein [Vulgatibacter incomptus]|uniref:Colicin V production protein n=1 Tax=Vulgatibacter incomptus TaxID=1391653 RepID=A0A0K1PAW1_9BACT|nr:CvpA family protein [Vulgatibacter incomptus]AKU90678.1 Colicin V production protein [Vulgatibacter incomptus]